MNSGDRVKFFYIAINQYNSRKAAGTLEEDAVYFVYDNNNSDNNYIAVGDEPFDHQVSVALNKSIATVTNVASAKLHSRSVSVTPTTKTVKLNSSSSGTVKSFSNSSSTSVVSSVGESVESFGQESIVGVGGSVSISGIDTNTPVTASKVTDWGAPSTWNFSVSGSNLTISGANGRIASGSDVTASHVTSATTDVAIPGTTKNVVQYPDQANTYVSSVTPVNVSAVSWSEPESVNVPEYSLSVDNQPAQSVTLLSNVSAQVADDTIDITGESLQLLDSETTVSNN